MSDPGLFQSDQSLSPQGELDRVASLLMSDEDAGLHALDDLLRSHPRDARLFFLKGSVLAGRRDYDQARALMARAVGIAPEFDIARFQWGFLTYTSGLAAEAAQIWQPLSRLGDQHPLRQFAAGLERLAADDQTGAVALLRSGMEANGDNPALNRDMGLLIQELERASSGPEEEEMLSETQLLLQQSAGTRH